MASSFLHKVQKTGRINVRECTPGLDLLRHYGNETSGGALSARHLIRPVSNYVENGPPMNRKRAYQNLFYSGKSAADGDDDACTICDLVLMALCKKEE